MIEIALVFILCSQVLDGDTCKTADGAKIRFLAIDAPEKDQRYGMESKTYLTNLILNKDVTLVGNKKDLYGRSLRYVMLNGVNVNETMIRSGNSWVYLVGKKSPLRNLENTARKEKLGLWADPEPVAPWIFRKLRKVKHGR